MRCSEPSHASPPERNGGSSWIGSPATRSTLSPGSEGFTVHAWNHQWYGWVMLALSVGSDVDLYMVLNTGLYYGAISVPARERLIMLELLPPVNERTVLLENLALSGNPVADLRVRVRPSVAQLDVDGILGLEFLRQFTDIHFNVPSLRLTLRR